ncbi:MAG: cysteine--tRNA ligase [Chlamydiae bacterium]|nr:cysteine--tRNA ligase [Chlamydiota bacterium]
MKNTDFRLHLYNTESKQIEPFTPINGQTVLMYTCGPTVYNYAHIGNFRTYVFEDILRRSLKFFGMKVDQVMNLTDIDDKTLKGAIEMGVSLKEFTSPYITAFFEDLDTLGIERVEHYPAATQYIDEMIKMIQGLLNKGVAYQGSEGSIYFSIKQFPSYGRLSHLHLDELEAGASDRIAADDYDKDQACDFVLWKSYDPERDGKIYWDSPFGKGRPGWHIECSAMAMNLLGESIDIHVGGVDNMFPHHENEIAQCEAFSEKHFVKHWLHSEHLLVDHKKMSKRLGNFYTLRDLLDKGFTGKEVRYALMQTHYRTQLNFTFQGLDAARNSLDRLDSFIKRLRSIQTELPSSMMQPVLEALLNSFTAALSDDLNISCALGAIFDAVREINILCDADKVSKYDAKAILDLFSTLNTVLNVLPLDDIIEEIPQELKDALEKRQKARQDKNWKDSDFYRDFIISSGYVIEDTPSGARLKKKKDA